MDTFFEFGIILIATSIVSIIISFLKQPLVIGYIISGVLLGPLFFNVLDSGDQLELFSKIGISILLFIVGINLNFKSIKETGKVSVITGVGQILFTSVIGYFILNSLGFDKMTSIYGAIALTFSSTIIILKLLSDKGDLDKLYGRVSVGFLLVQDLVATLLLIFVPIFVTYKLSSDGSGFDPSILFLVLKGLGLMLLIYLISKYVFGYLFDFISKNSELLLVVSISWGLVVAGLFAKIGFSIEIGALVAGLSLSSLYTASEISARLRPLRDFFIVVFFILLGAHLQFPNIASVIAPVLILSLFVLIGNPLIVFILMNLSGFKRKTSFMAGLTVAQISEFSLILMSLGLTLNHVSKESVSVITLVGVLTIAGSAYMVLYSEKLYKFVSPVLRFLEIKNNKNKTEKESLGEEFKTIIFGFGRVGQEFVSSLIKAKENFLIVDHKPDVIKDVKVKNFNFRYGDVEDIEFLEDINFVKSNTIISTVPDFKANELLVKCYRKHNKEGHILIVAKSVKESEHLYKLGATFVINTYLLGVEHAANILLDHSVNPNIFKEERKRQSLKYKFNQSIINNKA